MKYGVALAAAWLCVLMLMYGDAVRTGALEGLHTCAVVIIPSLYLFMAVSGFIAASEAGNVLSKPLAGLTRRVFKLPACVGVAIALSFIGGYPVGAKTISALQKEGRITDTQAQRAICFCCNAGPSFVVTAVGAGMMGNMQAGAVLLAAHIISALAIGAFISIRVPVPPKEAAQVKTLGYAEAFIIGVNQATRGMLSICAFVVFFSALGALLDASGLTNMLGGETGRTLLIGLFEVTSGCVAAAALPGQQPIILIPLFLSFAGLSIFFQVRSAFAGMHMRFSCFLFCRMIHGLLTFACSYPFLSRMSLSKAVFGPSVQPVGYHTPNTPVTTVLLLLLFGILLLGITSPLSGRRRK